MAKKKESAGKKVKGYEIQVTGRYFALDPMTGIKTKKHYKPESFKFQEMVKYKDGLKRDKQLRDGMEVEVGSPYPNIVESPIIEGNVALHLIRRFYIKPRLLEKYADFQDVYTCEIFSKEEIYMDQSEITNPFDKPIKEMTESELSQFVTLNDLIVTLSDYGDLGDKKLAVKRAYAEKNGENLSEEDFIVLGEEKAEETSDLLG